MWYPQVDLWVDFDWSRGMSHDVWRHIFVIMTSYFIEGFCFDWIIIWRFCFDWIWMTLSIGMRLSDEISRDLVTRSCLCKWRLFWLTIGCHWQRYVVSRDSVARYSVARESVTRDRSRRTCPDLVGHLFLSNENGWLAILFWFELTNENGCLVAIGNGILIWIFVLIQWEWF